MATGGGIRHHHRQFRATTTPDFQGGVLNQTLLLRFSLWLSNGSLFDKLFIFTHVGLSCLFCPPLCPLTTHRHVVAMLPYNTQQLP